MKHTYLLFIALFSVLFSHFAHAQTLSYARQKGVFAYIFKIKNEQAGKLLETGENDFYKIDDSYLQTVIDSFPADSTYRKPLSLGHYLEVRVENNNLIFKLISVNNTEIQVLIELIF
jgi:hypothetical protein